MAEAIVSIIVDQIFDKSINLLSQKNCLPRGFEVEVLKLQKSLSAIQAVLEDAEQQQVKRGVVRSWLKKLKVVAYDADDVLDEITTEFHGQEMDTRTSLVKKVYNFFSTSNQIAFCNKMTPKIKEINDKIDDIRKAKVMSLFRTGYISDRNREVRKTHSIVVDNSTVVGRDGDYSTVVKTLISSSPNEETVSVLPIVGMGGLGKTTLAQLAYHDETVKKHFHLRTWVCVSDDFDVTRLIREIIESAMGTICNLTYLDELGIKLRDNLRGMKFLLVLDDVSNEEIEKWSLLKTCLVNHAARGSKILVTTRNETFAEIMGTLPMHRLEVLTDHHCWSIFRQQVFMHGGVEETHNLVKIGKEIVRKCGGLPLAAKILGGLLRSGEENEWLSVRDSEIGNLSQNGLLRALKLGYENLPSHLKQCFAYCSIFPKDHKIKKDMLIQLWIAEGFIRLDQRLSLEDIANEYFNNLFAGSFFRNIQKDVYGDIIACEMHYLIHDLAQFASGNECSIVQADELERVHDKTRRLSFVNNVRQQTYHSALHITEKSSLHTFLMCHTSHYSTLSHEILLSFKYLRVLDLSIFKLVKLSPSIGKLIHLRYLDLSFTDVEELPKSITHLFNLQTLKLINCWDIVELPKGITKMVNLRHLEINKKDISMPKDIGKLTNLQTLSIFPVPKYSQCDIGELGRLQHLRGNLEILFLENLRSRDEASKAKLNEKEKLLCLKLWWSRENFVAIDAEDIMEGLQPPPQLKGLEIFYFPGVKIPSWMRIMRSDGDNGLQQQQLPSRMSSSLLPSLMLLRIKSCTNLQSLSDMAGFPFLKQMYIEDCGKLTSLPEQLGKLESLESLWIRNCPNLTSLPPGIQSLKSLEKLRIEGCPSLCRRCERKTGEDWQLISHIPIIILDGQLASQSSTFDPFGLLDTHASGSQLRNTTGEIRAQDLSPRKAMPQPPIQGSIGYLFVLWFVWLSSTQR